MRSLDAISTNATHSIRVNARSLEMQPFVQIMIVIIAICPSCHQPGLVGGLLLLQHNLARMGVVNRCNGNYDDQQQTECIEGDTSLSTSDFLASIVSTTVRVLTRFEC